MPRRGAAAVPAALQEEHRRDDRAERQERPDREVDAPGQDDDRHADRQDANVRYARQDVEQVPLVQKKNAVVRQPRRDRDSDRGDREEAAEQADSIPQVAAQAGETRFVQVALGRREKRGCGGSAPV